MIMVASRLVSPRRLLSIPLQFCTQIFPVKTKYCPQIPSFVHSKYCPHVHGRRFSSSSVHSEDFASLAGLEHLDPVTHKLICSQCSKPNSLTVSKCTACGNRLAVANVSRVHPNVFLHIINNEQDHNHEVVYRDSEILIFKDKFAISKHHLDAIPIEPIPDISHLTASHIPLIEKLHRTGIDVLEKMDIPLFRGKNIADFLICGFSLPVSVFHLHLHLVLPPLFALNQFKHPRFHSYEKVRRDLLTHGKVISDWEMMRSGVGDGGRAEGEDYHHRRVMLAHQSCLALIEAQLASDDTRRDK